MSDKSMLFTPILPVRKLAKTLSALAISLMLFVAVHTHADGPAQGSTPELTRTDVDRRINMAVRLIDKEKFPEAIRNLKLTVKQYRYNADAWNLLGFAYRQSGDIDAANVAYTKALAVNRYHLGALEYQGELFVMLGQLDNAKINLRLMSELCPVGCEEKRELEAAIAAAQ